MMVTVPRPLSGRKEPIGSPTPAGRLSKSAACPTLGCHPNSVTVGLRKLSPIYFPSAFSGYLLGNNRTYVVENLCGIHIYLQAIPQDLSCTSTRSETVPFWQMPR